MCETDKGYAGQENTNIDIFINLKLDKIYNNVTETTKLCYSKTSV